MPARRPSSRSPSRLSAVRQLRKFSTGHCSVTAYSCAIDVSSSRKLASSSPTPSTFPTTSPYTPSSPSSSTYVSTRWLTCSILGLLLTLFSCGGFGASEGRFPYLLFGFFAFWYALFEAAGGGRFICLGVYLFVCELYSP